jgi:tetratricopeptide (TPR) repeat protein
MTRVPLFLSSHRTGRRARRARKRLLPLTLGLLLPQLHARATASPPQKPPAPPDDPWALAIQWLQQHGWLGFAVAGVLILIVWTLGQAQNIESARRLLGLERKKVEPPAASHSTNRSNSSLITGGTFQSGRDQFIGGEHIHHTHLPLAPEPQLPETHTPDNLPDRTTSSERFVGRASELQRLTDLLAPEGTRAYLTGMGGVGKSELALQYAYDTRDLYRGGIVRLDARQGLAAMASQLVTFFRGNFPKVALPEDKSPTELLTWCWSQWPAGSTPPEPVLLILDDQRGENLPEEQGDTLGYAAERQLFAGLPPRFRRLISQREPAPTGAKAIDLPLLQRGDSLELLALQAGEDGPARLQVEPQAADALCVEVGDLPLALVLLGARLSDRPEMPLSDLLADLQAKGAEARALQEAHPELGAQRGVVEALLISWEPLSEAAKSLGILLGVMAPAAIPWELVEACRLPDQAVEEGSAFGRQQVALRRAQLLERLGDGLYKLHPLVWQFMRLQAKGQEETACRWCRQLAGAVAQVCQERIPQMLTLEQMDALEPLLAHIRQVALHYTAELNTEDLIGPFVSLTRVATHQGALGNAMRWSEKGLEECERRLGPKHPSTAMALGNLATLLFDAHRLADAEKLMRRSLAINIDNYGPDHPSVVTDVSNLAQLLQAGNQLAEAEDLMQRVLQIDEANFGFDHANVAMDLNNLSQLLQSTGRLAEAEPLMRRALSIDTASFGRSHPRTAKSLNNLAALLQAANRLEEAETLMIEAAGIVELNYGEKHPYLASVLGNLALLLQATNRLTEAAPLFERALAIDEAIYGPDHPNVARDLNNIALLLYDTGRPGEAECKMRQALQIFSSLLRQGFQHPNHEAAIDNYKSLLQVLNLSEQEIDAKIRSL